MREDAKRWLESAKDELRKSKENFGLSNFDLSSFLCQQAVEKALKAAILEKKKKLIKTHDIVFLAVELGAPAHEVGLCKELAPIYTETRYPDAKGSFKQFSKEQTEQDIKNTEAILKWIKKLLS